MKRKIYKVIITVLILIEIPFMYLTFKSLDSFKHKDEDIKQETINTSLNDRRNTVAIMVQDDDLWDFHEAENREAWPLKADYYYYGSKCTDSEGAEVPSTEIITFNEPDYSFDINTKNSIYCTLYFAKGRPALEAMHKYSGTTLGGGANGTAAVFGLIRYKGTKDQVQNNYICFGTTDKDKCKATPNTYMYRIIGITDGSTTNTNLGLTGGQLKIIKNSMYSSGVFTGNNSCVSFDSSGPKSTLNSSFLNSIKNGENGTYWDNLISNPKWYVSTNNGIGSSEQTGTLSGNMKVGIMYQSDYYNAGSNNNTNWIFLQEEFTMSITSTSKCRDWGMTYAAYVESSGVLTNYYQNGTTRSYRPVFYLGPVNLSGIGSSDDPFIITNAFV